MSSFLIIIYAICSIYLILNFKHDIQMLQQNSYRVSRYWRWLRRSGDMLSASRLIDLAMLFMLFTVNMLDIRLIVLVVAMVCVTKGWLVITKKHKKPLVFTRRVWRLYSVASILGIGCFAAVAIICGNRSDIGGWYSCASVSLGVLLLICILSWAVVILSLFILHPVEKMINRRYWNDASRILHSMPDLKVIGITGSYGKTSTKHYLQRILSEKYDVLMTPGSFNTPMGVIRTVREMMKPYHQVFICEMGAKQIGDIREICNLVQPHIGVVTAVGPMHLESFKSIENVQRTKFELVDALPADGLAVVNNDFEYCANRNVENVTCIRYAIDNTDGCSYIATNISITSEGSEFTIEGNNGYSIRLKTRLVGDCNISNLMAAVVIARQMGVSDEQIRLAVSDIKQVEHRLSIRQTPGGVTIIDDAFNSNPSGSKMAVDVLSNFNEGKRIIVTPGMIELGDQQYDLNKEFGSYLGNRVDIAIIVGHYNRDAILEGISSSSLPEKNVIVVDSFNEAQQRLQPMLCSGATVLYENDLPDTFK